MTQEKPIPWKKLGHKTVYRDRIHIVQHDVELPNGKRITYDVEHGDGFAVATFIKTADNKIILSHQYRFPLDRWIYDLPGGGAQAGEDIETAAIRECREEVGVAPKKIIKLATFYPNPGRGNWPAHVFYCEEFELSKIELQDPSEHIERVLVPVADLKKLIDSQEIIDPSLLIGWYAACSKGYIKP